MTYATFLLVVVVPPLIFLLLWSRPRPPRRAAYLLMPLLALLYTTPWDNYLVWKGVWGYPEGRILLTIGAVPLEEYCFFILQPLLTGAFLSAVAGQPPAAARAASRVTGGGFWLLVVAAGVLLVALGGRALYLGLIMAYFAPVFVLQWAFGGDLLLGWWRPLALGVAIPTCYLSLADLFAVTREGIWWISAEYTIGWQVAGLPIEEILFFGVTNIAVVQGLLLAWHPEALQRLTSPRA